jgi:uncharacterized protein (DUF1501 family)
MARNCSCNEFTRAQLLRAGVAQAGRGLPSIEPGMPLPAGTGMDRRSFLLRSAGAAVAVYGGSMLSPRRFEEGIAQASADSGDQRVLVSIFMEGGWDALSVLAPVKEEKGLYQKLRPELGLKEGEGKLFGSEDERLMWHPAAGPLAELQSEGKVTTFPGIGYSPPDESHFTSRHYWEVGQLDVNARTGWMGRYLDIAGDPANPLQGLSLDYSLAPALATEKMPVAAVSKPSDYTMWANGLSEPILAEALTTFGDLGGLNASSPALEQARSASLDTSIVLNEMAVFTEKQEKEPYTPTVPYPTGNEFGERLAVLAAMLQANMPIKCASLTAVGSFDTHSDEQDTLAQDLGASVSAIYAFQRDLEQRGLADRVVIQLWSEFGRRPQENGSGTDHGAGGVAFLIGTQVTGKMVGEFPGLASLDENENLRNTSDFRAMYCSLLEQWFQTEAGPIVPEAPSERPQLIR